MVTQYCGVPLCVGIFALAVGIVVLIFRRQIVRSDKEHEGENQFDREPEPILRGGVGTTPIVTIHSAIVTGIVAIAVGAGFILRAIL